MSGQQYWQTRPKPEPDLIGQAMPIDTHPSTIRPAHGLLLTLLVGVLCALAPAASAQSTITAEAGFSQHTCYLGDQVVFQIAVENTDEVTPPDLSRVPGAAFSFSGTSNESRTSVSIINGRRHESSTRRLVLRWVATPNEPGTVIVPPLLVGVDGGQVVETNQAQIRVIEPEPAEHPVLRVTTDAENVYVNQTVRVRVVWLLLRDIDEFSFRSSRIDDALTVRPVTYQRQGADRIYETDIFGVKTHARLGYGTLDGNRHRTYEFELLVTPNRPGRFTLGPVAVSFDERIAPRSTRRVIARTEPIVLDVRELPSQGRPPGFNGLLGIHAIEARASASDVSVGDPIELVVTISGPEPMAAIKDGPDLNAIDGFTDDFRLSSEGWTFQPGGRPGERTFATTIRASHDRVSQIPPIALPFFDPVDGEYHVARSRPIPLRVRPVREVTVADAVIASGPVSISREPLTPTAPALWAIDRGSSVLADAGPLDTGILTRPTVLATLAAPPCVFAISACLVAAGRRTRDESARRRRNALPAARRALRKNGPTQAVRVYLGEAFGATPAAITGADGRRLLDEAGVGDADAMAQLISIHEAERYGDRDPGTPPADPARVLDLLRRVDRSIRGRA